MTVAFLFPGQGAQNAAPIVWCWPIYKQSRATPKSGGSAVAH